MASSKDQSGGMGPQSWEGFGIHLANVINAPTTGGIPVSELEQNFRDRFGDYTAFDQFMDYGVTYFTADLQPYHDAFTKDQVPFLLAEWDTEEQGTWYSLLFLVNRSHYVIELVSHMKPAIASSVSLPKIEQRMSATRCAKYQQYSSHPAHVIFPTSVNRATSNITMIDEVYTQLFKFNPSTKIDQSDVTRRCYHNADQGPPGVESRRLQSGPGGGRSFDVDVCFTQRTPDAEKDKIFSVVDFEEMLWSEHAGTLASGPKGSDKYTDHHYSMFPQEGITTLQAHFKANPPYPITKDTRLAYACKQCYIIDPTGWSIQPGGPGCSDWQNCGYSGQAVVV